MKTITFEDIKALNIDAQTYYDWIDFPLRNRDKFTLPTKVKIPMVGDDYCNIMPCAFPDGNVLGLKVINRNENRRNDGRINLDSQILLYSYETCDLLCVMDGNYITTMRTAAVAVHTIINMVEDYSTIAMVGLGNIGTAIGDMLFQLTKDKEYTVKLMQYKGQENRFINRFKEYKNVTFKVCDSQDVLMKDSDLIVSSVTNAEKDFCDESIYKPGCTIIPVHMKGFMECDLTFDNIVVSDLIRAKSFKYYDQYKRLLYTDDVLNGTVNLRNSSTDRTLIYNLGLAITDMYYAAKIYQMMDMKETPEIKLGTDDKFYV
ncbi:MAG: hypothetical protein ACLRTZ_13730 [Agathobacter sp.]|jgi:ornithine cyclodeaminase/alanine dehydrogenase-like protein (mu-crystallin family)